jgi:glutathione S-transferase
MRILYHFTNSPFSRRTRLALSHKGLDCELRDARENPACLEQARRLVAIKTFPVFVDGDRPLADSGAITRWLDAAYPQGGRIWPAGDEAVEALEITSLVDVALTHVIDLGSRYYALHDAATNQNVAQVLSLGWSLPAPLSRWADSHRRRPDVTALG